MAPVRPAMKSAFTSSAFTPGSHFMKGMNWSRGAGIRIAAMETPLGISGYRDYGKTAELYPLSAHIFLTFGKFRIFFDT